MVGTGPPEDCGTRAPEVSNESRLHLNVRTVRSECVVDSGLHGGLGTGGRGRRVVYWGYGKGLVARNLSVVNVGDLGTRPGEGV